MKRTLLFTAVILALTAAAARNQAPRVGDVAPEFKLVDQSNRATTLSAARGHKVVLVFYRGYW